MIGSTADSSLADVINATVTRAKDQAWHKENTQDILPVSGAAKALQQARQKGYQVVYLALAAEKPTDYRKMRDWVRYWTKGTAPFPEGVVLSRFTLPGPDQDSRPWQKTALLLDSLFALPKEEGKHLAIAATIEVAQQLHAAGLRTLYLGAGEDLPPEVQRLPSWEEVRRLFEK